MHKAHNGMHCAWVRFNFLPSVKPQPQHFEILGKIIINFYPQVLHPTEMRFSLNGYATNLGFMG